MPEDKKKDPLVDVGETEGADVELESKQEESSNENTEDGIKSIDTSAQSNEQPVVQDSKQETEIKDQGTDTEAKKELEDYSEGVKKRIAKLTKKMREAERQREAAIEYARKIQGEKETLAGRLTKLDTGYVTEMENRIKSSMEAAAAKLAQARTDGDLKAEIAAQTEIAKLGYEDARLSEIKSKQALETKVDNAKPVQDYVDRLREQPTQQEQPINPDPKAQGWAQKNTWFGQDSAMTYTAFDLHKKLVEEEGYDPQSDEYYTEIDKRIRLEFPHKFATNTVQTTNTSKPTQTVASASRAGGKSSGRKTVRLTPSQVAIAKKLGVPLEEYAKQLTTKEV